MYNPHSLHECELEKARRPRTLIDALMTGIGGIASVSSVPQVIKIWQTHTVVGISLTTELIALIAVVCWFFYGLYIRNKPLWITSGLSTIVLGIVVLQILSYR
ncbi:MAG TPA: PQ-loop domain-containing transporter [Candidatus Paceibacterota bacterium]|nr:PQ-loop domain-containing transporter [Candidatus Paceibacterota bacterium]